MRTEIAKGIKAPVSADDFFERWAWLYALCRERLFTDHTSLVARIIQERTQADHSHIFLEAGCGPGFYSIVMARRFPGWQFIGMDQSNRLLGLARKKASVESISNCNFILGDATCPSDFPGPVDLIFASRLLFILPDRYSALSAMHAGLRAGGSLLIAEPLPGWRSDVALRTMRLLKSIRPRSSSCGNTVEPQALAHLELSDLAQRLPWSRVQCWSDHRYQYLLCDKS